MKHKYFPMAAFAASVLVVTGCETVPGSSPAIGENPATAQTDCASLIVIGDVARALVVCRRAAETGDPVVQLYFGVAYFYGQGVTQDYAEAAKWFRKAADQGEASAQISLGHMYDQGKGVTRDYAEAAKWFRKAAERGMARAQAGLGKLYFFGQGVTWDRAKAYALLKSAKAQDPNLLTNIFELTATQMTEAEISRGERLARECAEKKYVGCGF